MKTRPKNREIPGGTPVAEIPDLHTQAQDALEWFSGLPESLQPTAGGLFCENLNGSVSGRDIFPNIRD